MAATIYAVAGTGADLKLFRTSKKMVTAIGASTGITEATDEQRSANPVVDTGALMRSRHLTPIIGNGKKSSGRYVSIRFLCAKDKVETLLTAGKVTIDAIDYRLSISGRRQILK